MNVFFETVQLARRWTGPDALQAGIVQQLESLDQLQQAAIEKAQSLAPLATNRANYGGQKESIYGKDAVINRAAGPAHMLKNAKEFHR